MIPLLHSIEAAESWKVAVKNLWKTQRLILIFSILTSALLLTASILLLSGIMVDDDITDLSVILIIAACIVGFAGVCFAIATYIFQWMFYFDLKRWGQSAPTSLTGNIRTLATCTLVTLIGGIVAGFFNSFSIIPYAGIIASIMSSLVSLGVFGFEIIKFVMFIRIKNDQAMPYMARTGASNIFCSYIVGIITGVVSAIVLSIAMVSFFVGALSEDNTYSEYEYVEEYNYDDAYETTESSLLSGIFGQSIDDIDDEEIEEFFDNASNSTAMVTLLIIGILIIMFGSITSYILYYYGWWLISKSELELLPERVNNDN